MVGSKENWDENQSVPIFELYLQKNGAIFLSFCFQHYQLLRVHFQSLNEELEFLIVDGNKS